MLSALKREFQPPDDLLLEAGAVGEVLVARVRLVTVGLIVLMPSVAWLTGSPRHEVLTGLVVSLIALFFAIELLRRARRDGADTRGRFVSAAFDVTSISMVLALFLLQGFPHVAVNSRVVWELYLLAIAATALRADSRVCLVSGALAFAQYAFVLFAATRFGDLNDPKWAPFIYGQLAWGDQISRLILIVAATLLALACVHQTRKLLLLSSQDQLTGIGNRAWLDTRLRRELNEAGLDRRPLSLAMVDVDAFKRFNDDHGHLAGDQALHVIAQRLNQRIDTHGFVARYGGEEFVLVMARLTIEQAALVCDALREAFDTDHIDLPASGKTVKSPSLSMGLAAFQPDDSADSLINRADRALIRAKQAGRNRIELA